MPLSGDFYPFNDHNIDGAHNASGVYALYYQRKDDTPVYIGRASGTGVTIRSRLWAHRKGHAGPCTQQSVWFKQELNSFPIARERELIEEFKGVHAGSLPLCNDVDV